MNYAMQRAVPTVTWTNGEVALAKDLIFGLCLRTDTCWFPVDQLDGFDIGMVQNLVDHNPSCPWLTELYSLEATR